MNLVPNVKRRGPSLPVMATPDGAEAVPPVSPCRPSHLVVAGIRAGQFLDHGEGCDLGTTGNGCGAPGVGDDHRRVEHDAVRRVSRASAGTPVLEVVSAQRSASRCVPGRGWGIPRCAPRRSWRWTRVSTEIFPDFFRGVARRCVGAFDPPVCGPWDRGFVRRWRGTDATRHRNRCTAPGASKHHETQ